MSVNLGVRSSPAMIQETSGHPNRHLCHRGSHNDADHGWKIKAYQPFSARLQEPLRTAKRAFHSTFGTLLTAERDTHAACASPVIGVLEATWDFGSSAMEARILRPLVWFWLPESRTEPRSPTGCG